MINSRMEEALRSGWVCPSCKKVNSPDVKSCDHKPIDEESDQGKRLLTEWSADRHHDDGDPC